MKEEIDWIYNIVMDIEDTISVQMKDSIILIVTQSITTLLDMAINLIVNTLKNGRTNFQQDLFCMISDAQLSAIWFDPAFQSAL